MVFTNAALAIELVDDLRSLLDVKETTLFDLKDTEIFLISNLLDDYEANEVVDMLMDIRRRKAEHYPGQRHGLFGILFATNWKK